MSSTAARMTSSTEHHSRRGSAAPACRRERSSSLSTRRARRSALLDDRVAKLVAVLASVERRRAERPARGQIAVSGERRSCETARSSAVLSTSLRRRRASRRPRLQRVALERGAEQRLQRGHDPLARDVLGIGRNEQRPDVAERDRCLALAAARHAPSTIAAESTSSASASRFAAVAAARRRGSGAPSSTRASSAARSASRRRSLGLARPARGQLGRARWRRPRRRGRRRARPSSRASAIVNRPVGGMWKKLNASARRDARGQPEPATPRSSRPAAPPAGRARPATPRARSRAADTTAASSPSARPQPQVPRPEVDCSWLELRRALRADRESCGRVESSVGVQRPRAIFTASERPRPCSSRHLHAKP